MKKIEYRAVIRFFVLKGFKPKEIYEQLLEVYKESSPSKRTVEFLAGEFKRGRTGLKAIHTKDDQKPQPHQKSLSKFIILLVKIQV